MSSFNTTFNIPLPEDKREGPTTILEYFGILLDSAALEARLPPDKLQKINSSRSYFLLPNWTPAPDLDLYTPVTPSLLRRFYHLLHLASYDHFTLWAALLVAFFGFLRSSELLALRYSSHSFEIGAASTAAAAGIPDWKIQALGRWSSDCYDAIFVSQRWTPTRWQQRWQGASCEE